MNKNLLLTLEEETRLHALVSGFAILHKIDKIEPYQVSEDEIIVGVLKTAAGLLPVDEKNARRLIIAEVKKIYKPFAGSRKIHVHFKFTD